MPSPRHVENTQELQPHCGFHLVCFQMASSRPGLSRCFCGPALALSFPCLTKQAVPPEGSFLLGKRSEPVPGQCSRGPACKPALCPAQSRKNPRQVLCLTDPGILEPGWTDITENNDLSRGLQAAMGAQVPQAQKRGWGCAFWLSVFTRGGPGPRVPWVKVQNGYLTQGPDISLAGERATGRAVPWPDRAGRQRHGGGDLTGCQIHLLVVRVQLGLGNPGEVGAPWVP